MKEPEAEHVYFTRKECNGFCILIGVFAILCSALLYLTTREKASSASGFFLGAALGYRLSRSMLWRMSIERLITLFPAQKPLIRKYDRDSPLFLRDWLVPQSLVETVTQGDPRRDAILQDYRMVLGYMQVWIWFAILLCAILSVVVSIL